MTTDKEYLERLQRKTEVNENGCWIWQGYKNHDGYGSIRYNKKLIRTHRLMYQLAVAPLGDLHVLHKCDTPSCINPDHLFLGTHKDNMHDAIAKGRMKFGSNSKGSKFTEKQVVLFRKGFKGGQTLDDIIDLSGASRTAVSAMLSGRSYKHVKMYEREDAQMNTKGEAAPTFKGYYVTPWGEFTSLHDAANAYEGDGAIHFSTIDRYCKTNNDMVVRKSSIGRSKYLTKEDAGKTYAQLGFSFKEV